MSRDRSRLLCLLFFEGTITCLCCVAAIWIRFGDEANVVLSTAGHWVKVLLLMGVVQSSFYIFDLYDLQRIRQRTALYVRICQALGLAAIALAVLFYSVPDLMLGRGVFLLSLLLMLAVMAWWRVGVTWLLGHPRLSERVLILGTEQNAIELARQVLERPECGYKIVGFIGDDPALVGRSLINPQVVGLTSQLESVVCEQQADRIVVAVSDRRGHLPLGPLLSVKLGQYVAVEESSSFYERLTGKISTAMLRPSWLIFSNGSRTLRLYGRLRRLADVVSAAVGLLISLPVMLLTAIAIKLDSAGPILYIQERVGARNRNFRIIKFRTMLVDAEKDGPVWAGEHDPRVTRVGRVIRKLRVDELPQFINILTGDMSVIGPRPERPVFVRELEEKIPYYSQRHLLKPGLTGWAQIRYPYGASIEDSAQKLEYDLYYIKNQSPVLDAIILFETVRIVLFGRGAR